jgi:NADPH2:quinone reductase
MQAIGFLNPTPKASSESFQSFTLPDPAPSGRDLLIKPQAVSVNPVDYKERSHRAPSKPGKPVILGWDGAGEVVAVGDSAHGFKTGDRVFWSGELNRDGSNSTLQLVDHRLVGRMPKSLDFAEAAALPLTSVTAYEALFERMRVPTTNAGRVLIIGGAGGVGSVAIQLLKALTDAEVYATAGRPDSAEWVHRMGADVVVNRHDLNNPSKRSELPEFDYVLCTTHAAHYEQIFPEIIKPLGVLGLIDDPKQFDFPALKRKSIAAVWELIFTKSLFQVDVSSQGNTLNLIADLIDQKRLTSTKNRILEGLTPEALTEAHRLQEAGESIGKTVIAW